MARLRRALHLVAGSYHLRFCDYLILAIEVVLAPLRPLVTSAERHFVPLVVVLSGEPLRPLQHKVRLLMFDVGICA